MKKLIISSISISAAVFSLAVILPTISIYAQPSEISESQPATQDRRSKVNERQETAQSNKEERKVEATERLTETKLKVCQKRESNIKNIMARISDRSTKQLDVFTKISERTQAFYTDKAITLTNYDELVAEVDAKKVAAELLVAKVDQTSTTFTCDSSDPKAISASFKQSIGEQRTALKEYKTAVKNLIVGVKSVQSTVNDPAVETDGDQ